MKVISAAVGIMLLGASLILAYLSNSNATQMLAKKDAIVMKYVSDSTSALENGDTKTAIKFAKLAIKADPSSKKGFTSLEDAYKAKYKPSEDYMSNGGGSEQPAADEEEEEEDMGC